MPTLQPTFHVDDCTNYCVYYSQDDNASPGDLIFNNRIATVSLATDFTAQFSIRGIKTNANQASALEANIVDIYDVVTEDSILRVNLIDSDFGFRVYYNNLPVTSNDGLFEFLVADDGESSEEFTTITVTVYNDGRNITISSTSLQFSTLSLPLSNSVNTTARAYHVYASNPDLVTADGYVQNIQISGTMELDG